jgi:hypothetical protein
VVVGRLYEDIDKDHGSELLYSSPLADDMSGARDSIGTQALQISITTGRPVRVLRAKGEKWAGAPREGIRYDGLYKVVESKEGKKETGGSYIQFHLVRLDDQAELDRSKPTAPQVSDCERIADG